MNTKTMIKRVFAVVLAVLISASAAGSAPAGTDAPPAESSTISIDAKDIIRRMDELLWGRSTRGTFEMTVTTPRWERTLTMEAWEKRREKTFIRILSPAKERGVVTLRIGNEMWNYLPRVERVIKIPPSMMLQSWMGSDFTNDDLVKESSIVDDYTHEVISTEDVDGFSAYRIRATPLEDAPVVWGGITYWVRTEDFVPLREEFYGEDGDLVRVLEFTKIRNAGGRTIPTRWTMTPVKKKGRRTVFEIIEIEFNAEIDDSVFTHRNMTRTMN